MFKYSEKDLYDRCGYDETKFSYGSDEFTGEFYTMNDGTKIPIMHKTGANDGLSRHLVLKTFKGYICVDSIASFRDIFDDSKYLKDETEWIFPYLSYKHSFYDDSVSRLANVLGKHWKGNLYKNISKDNNTAENKNVKTLKKSIIKR